MSESGVKLVGWLVMAAWAGATLAVPQPVDPWEMPSLVLSRKASSEAIELDRALAGGAPNTPEARTLRSLFLDHGRSEATPPYEPRDYNRRQIEIHRTTKALLEDQGAGAVEAMRAKAVEEFAQVFSRRSHEAQNERETAMLGGFPELATRYGLVYRGSVIAPDLTVRTLYKARWNAIHRRPSTEGFAAIELQAYWGWFALHGWGHPLPARKDALVTFRDAGGHGTDEAAALFALLSGRPEHAAVSLQKLYASRGELRLRNIGLGAMYGSRAGRSVR